MPASPRVSRRRRPSRPRGRARRTPAHAPAQRQARRDVAGGGLSRQHGHLHLLIRLRVIWSTDVGKSSLSSSTVTPASTASSDGYAGRPLFGVNAWMVRSTLRRRRAVVEILVVPRRLERFELRDGHVAVGARGVGRIAERELRIGERVVGVRHRVRAIGTGRRRQVGARDQLEQDLVPAQDAAAAPVVDRLALVAGDVRLRALDGRQLGLIVDAAHLRRERHGELRWRRQHDHLPRAGVGVVVRRRPAAWPDVTGPAQREGQDDGGGAARRMRRRGVLIGGLLKARNL